MVLGQPKLIDAIDEDPMNPLHSGPIDFGPNMVGPTVGPITTPLPEESENDFDVSGKKKAHKHRLVPGTIPGFLLSLHSGGPFCPWNKPRVEGRHEKFMR